jgi:hypothetical protein
MPLQYLRTADGAEYLLLERPPGAGLFTITLSPSGRWLGWSEGSSLHLRDLTGRSVRRYDGRTEIVGASWPPNGRWLLLAENRHDDWTLVDLETGALSYPTGLEGAVTGLSNEGRILLATMGQSADDARFGTASFRWFAPVDTTSDPTVTAAGQAELRYPGSSVLGRDARTAVVAYFTAESALDPYFAGGPLTALVEFDLVGGREVARRQLDAAEQWQLQGGWVNGVTATRRREGVQELIRLDQLAADPFVLGQFALDAEVTAPGTTTH